MNYNKKLKLKKIIGFSVVNLIAIMSVNLVVFAGIDSDNETEKFKDNLDNLSTVNQLIKDDSCPHKKGSFLLKKVDENGNVKYECLLCGKN